MDFFGQQLFDIIYEWDLDKRIWFFKIMEVFIVIYQVNYGFFSDVVFSFIENI